MAVLIYCDRLHPYFLILKSIDGHRNQSERIGTAILYQHPLSDWFRGGYLDCGWTRKEWKEFTGKWKSFTTFEGMVDAMGLVRSEEDLFVI